MKLLRHVSFVDCPGHDIFMATMLNGAVVMDGALLLIGANDSCPQPQTSEHLAAVDMMCLKHIIIVQNKIDLIKETAALNQHQDILNFVQGTAAEGAPIVPVSAQLKYNIDVLCEYIVNKIPVPIRDFTSPPNMIIIRSFDVNKPGSEADDIKGGIAGGSILRNELQFAVPGGLIGVGATIDPHIARGDKLVGHVLGEVGSLPDVFIQLEVNFFLLRRLLGVKSEKPQKVSKLVKGEILMLNIGSMTNSGTILAVKNDWVKLQLLKPVCTNTGEKVAISRRIERYWRLIGWGQIQAGQVVELKSD
ncbi:hypothetical protein LUZ60_007740 [Juncus effusus]|nr:hypothetical protein LUZ60_007740 [Juncus effusus]